MRLLSNRVAIQETDSGNLKSDLIYLPESVKKDGIRKGVVKLLGPEVDNGIRKGDLVIYNEYSSIDINYGEDDLKIVRSIEVMAVVLEDE